ncbi:MAG: hypothetical protein R3359_08030 [Marinirhabdus sp.]|nr:hypothetical protein [Marinirhabdus sp.]
MFRFVKKLVLFFVATIGLFLVVFFGTRFIEKKAYEGKFSSDVLAIVGNSHAKTALHDSIISARTPFQVKNYGVNGQSMFWTVIAARKLYHQGVRNFVFELNNGSYTSGWKTTDPARGSRAFKNKHYLTTDEWKYLWRIDSKFTSRLLFHVYWPSGSVNGEFQSLHKPFQNTLVNENKPKLDRNTIQVDFDDGMLHEFIAKHPDAQVLVIRAPQHPGFYDKFTAALELEFQKRLHAFKKHENANAVDFGHALSDDIYFADLGHMNYTGALTISPRVADAINAMLAN